MKMFLKAMGKICKAGIFALVVMWNFVMDCIGLMICAITSGR